MINGSRTCISKRRLIIYTSPVTQEASQYHYMVVWDYNTWTNTNGAYKTRPATWFLCFKPTTTIGLDSSYKHGLQAKASSSLQKIDNVDDEVRNKWFVYDSLNSPTRAHASSIALQRRFPQETGWPIEMIKVQKQTGGNACG